MTMTDVRGAAQLTSSAESAARSMVNKPQRTRRVPGRGNAVHAMKEAVALALLLRIIIGTAAIRAQVRLRQSAGVTRDLSRRTAIYTHPTAVRMCRAHRW